MYTIKKQFTFSASHQLLGLPVEHQCARLHGHNYIVEVELRDNELNEVGFVKDYGELTYIKSFIDTQLDHRHLNDVFVVNPTAENMARVLFNKFVAIYPQLAAVHVSETPRTWATYSA
jgi:6-pyruvoyltetrahydropterin/6-carboxytetrahydropterin synthase